MDKHELASGISREYFYSSYAYTKQKGKNKKHDEEIVDEETFILHYLLVYKLALKEIEELLCLPTVEEQIIYLKNRLK